MVATTTGTQSAQNRDKKPIVGDEPPHHDLSYLRQRQPSWRQFLSHLRHSPPGSVPALSFEAAEGNKLLRQLRRAAERTRVAPTGL